MKRTVLLVAAMAMLALVSGAYAAGQITGRSVKDGSLTGRDIKNHSLKPADFKGSVRGSAGPPGPPGPSTVAGITMVPGSTTVAAGDVDGGTIYCGAGRRAISGGFTAIAADGEVFIDEPSPDRSGWEIALDNFDSPLDGELSGYALCVPAGNAVAAGAHRRGFVRGAGVADAVGRRLAAHG
jgi:hypothetical protein